MTGVEARAVLDAMPYKGAQLFALYRIAEIVNEKNGWEWWQTNADLGAEIGVARETISRWMHEFVDDGWIEKTSVGDGRFGQATRYRFTRRFSVLQTITPSVTEDHTRVTEDHTQESDAGSHTREREQEREVRERKPLMPDFEQFWSVCPRKTGKGQARKAFAKAVKNGTPPAVIIEAMQTHALHWSNTRTESQFIPHPTTWINGERWEDELTDTRKETEYERSARLVAAALEHRDPQKAIGQ